MYVKKLRYSLFYISDIKVTNLREKKSFFLQGATSLHFAKLDQPHHTIAASTCTVLCLQWMIYSNYTLRSDRMIRKYCDFRRHWSRELGPFQKEMACWFGWGDGFSASETDEGYRRVPYCCASSLTCACGVPCLPAASVVWCGWFSDFFSCKY